jgi:uncharacterized cofD-like protein
MNIVGIGGGTGLPVLLRGLKEIRDRNADGDDPVRATAIVCVSDDGGSSGLLRQAFGIPAVGDLRNCMVALASGNPSLRDIFQYRLRGDFGLDGHTIGNLIVAALSARAGNIRSAIQLASEILDLKGHVLPVTEMCASLCAEFTDGDTACGETRIAARGKRIQRVWLEPQTQPASGVLEAIETAHAIVFGPGSLFTSVVPCLLPCGIAEAIADSPALKIMVCNLMTQPGETDSYNAADHVSSLQDYVGASGVDVCLLNSREISPAIAETYAATGARPVSRADDEVKKLGVTPIALDLLDSTETEVRHDPLKLARWIVALTRSFERARDLRSSEVRCFAAEPLSALLATAD